MSLVRLHYFIISVHQLAYFQFLCSARDYISLDIDIPQIIDDLLSDVIFPQIQEMHENRSQIIRSILSIRLGYV